MASPMSGSSAGMARRVSPYDLSSSYRLAWASSRGSRTVSSNRSIILMHKHFSNFYLCHITNWPKQVIWLCQEIVPQQDECHMMWTALSFYHMTLKGQSESFLGNKTNSGRMTSLSASVAKLRRCKLGLPRAILPTTQSTCLQDKIKQK